jgi:hypothetical protein
MISLLPIFYAIVRFLMQERRSVPFERSGGQNGTQITLPPAR